MIKLMPLLVSIVILAVVSNAQDSGAESIVFMTFDDLKAGTIIPADVRFVSSGQPDEAVLEAIAAAGFSVVVDLRSASEDRGFDEQKEVERLGLVYATVPIGGPSDVTFDNAAVLIQILDENEGRVFLHCSSGNRAGAIYALRKKLLGATNDEAVAEGKAAGLTRLESVVTERIGEE
jgi:uncharacterized protein (TIGR01244 family)